MRLLNYIMRLFNRQFFFDVSIALPEPDGWLANAMLNCLRTWHKQHGPGPWIVTSGDIEYLAKWAADLQRQHKDTRRRFRVATYPKQVR